MKSLEIKWLTGLLAFVLALGLLLGGNQAYQRYYIDEPLQEALERRSEVEEACIEIEQGIVYVTVKLAKVDNIQQEYYQLDKLLVDKLGKRPFELLIAEESSVELEEAYNNLQPAMYEAMAENRYLWLKEYLGEYCREGDLDCRLYIDEQRVYLQLCSKKDSLYKVIERQEKQQVAA